MTILASYTRARRVPVTHQRKLRSAANATGEAGGDTKPIVGSGIRKIARPMLGSRSVTCKGHAESGISCRGKAPRIAKASHASRRGEWKRSWPPSPRASCEKNAGHARSEGSDRGVRVGRVSGLLGLDGMPRNRDEKSPARPAIHEAIRTS